MRIQPVQQQSNYKSCKPQNLNFKGVVKRGKYLREFMAYSNTEDLQKFRNILQQMKKIADNRVHWIGKTFFWDVEYYEVRHKPIGDSMKVDKFGYISTEKTPRTKRLPALNKTFEDFYTGKINIKEKTNPAEESKENIVKEINELLVDSFWQ